MQKLKVVEHTPQWQLDFDRESVCIMDVLGDCVAAIHHVGSTSIPGIFAKPIIDILLEVRDITELDARSDAMESLGYEVMGEFGIEGRRYFRKDDPSGTRTHQIHAFAADSSEAVRHRSFRDYMIVHTDEAQDYSRLKRLLAAMHADDAEAYMDGKDAFIKQIDEKAARWRQNNR